MKSSAWLYLVLGAVALYVLWGLSVDATVGIEEDEINVGGWTRPPKSPPQGAAATSSEAISWTLLDELPL